MLFIVGHRETGEGKKANTHLEKKWLISHVRLKCYSLFRAPFSGGATENFPGGAGPGSVQQSSGPLPRV